MTKVLVRRRWMIAQARWRLCGLATCLLCASACSAVAADPGCPQTTIALYTRIRSVGLDPQRVYHVRGAAIDRPALHLDLDDGTLAFTEDICGRITGAMFEGDGEVRLMPPDRQERNSLALFTGMAILDEQFSSAFLRFNDDTAAALQPYLSPASEPDEFFRQWKDASRALADFDALRLLIDFSYFLPSTAPMAESPSSESPSPDQKLKEKRSMKFSPLLHAHLLGKKLGAFEVVCDASEAEPLWAGQARTKDGTTFFDIWTSFAPLRAGKVPQPAPVNNSSITSYRIQATVQPPTLLRASAELSLRIRDGGKRALLFELSRYLKVEAVEVEGGSLQGRSLQGQSLPGQALDLKLDFIQNPAIEGTQLRRKGDDLVAVVFNAPLAAGQKLTLRFTYAGEVLSEAGNGLLYVGERGTWYPSFGLNPAQFQLQFRCPANWTLVATGKQIAPIPGQEAGTSPPTPSERVSRWVSERPIPVAGFNLGKYVRAEAKAGHTLVEAYGTRVVENSFPKPPEESIAPPAFPAASSPRSRSNPPIMIAPPQPSPAHDAQAVAEQAAQAVQTFSRWFGAYPYGSLAFTQMPGKLSQGWPGLVFLASLAFLSPQEQADLHLDPLTRELDRRVLVHETAHQWWGDLVQWSSYRDQWISEGLANYASLLLLEEKNPALFREVLEKYRRDLLSKNSDGEWLRDAGPVTLGLRLESSHFPHGYDSISYERGTWLFHMLRSMLLDAQPGAAASSAAKVTRSRNGHAVTNARPSSDETFFRILRKIRDRYAGKKISTEELVEAFEENLPRPLWYENRPKLDWFLEGWIEGTAIPHIEAREIRIVESGGVDTVTGVLVQKDAPDDLVTAVPLYAATNTNPLVFLGQVLADGRETRFRLPAPAGTRKIVLDPEQTILRAPN